jgi:hypothetical protein
LFIELKMESQELRPKNTEDVDITQFFKWIRRGFEKTGDTFILSLATLRNVFLNNLIFFGIVTIIGLGLGFSYSQLLSKKLYKSSMVLSCTYLNTQILKNTIEKLNLLASGTSREVLMEELKVDKQTAENI